MLDISGVIRQAASAPEKSERVFKFSSVPGSRRAQRLAKSKNLVEYEADICFQRVCRQQTDQVCFDALSQILMVAPIDVLKSKLDFP